MIAADSDGIRDPHVSLDDGSVQYHHHHDREQQHSQSLQQLNSESEAKPTSTSATRTSPMPTSNVHDESERMKLASSLPTSHDDDEDYYDDDHDDEDTEFILQHPASAAAGQDATLASPAHSLSSTASASTRSFSSLSEDESSFSTDTSINTSSLTLTPPLAASLSLPTSSVWDTNNNSISGINHDQRRPPLVVSAKRLGSDVRRQHSKKRRRRRPLRRSGGIQGEEWMMDSLAFVNSTNNSDDDDGSRNKGDSIINNSTSTSSSSDNKKKQNVDSDDMEIDTTNGKRFLRYGSDDDFNNSGGVLAQVPAGNSGRNRSTGYDSSSSDEDEDDDNDFDENRALCFDPNHYSRHEANKRYWEWCYGPMTTSSSLVANTLAKDSFSANREPPGKGCLCIKKAELHFQLTTAIRDVEFHTPPISPQDSALVGSISSVLTEKTLNKKEIANDYDAGQSITTVKASNTFRSKPKTKQVQFGTPSAVEYVIGEPAGLLTPIPSDVARRRYSMDQKKDTVQEEEMTAETKQNNSILAQWEDAFDTEDEATSTSRSGRRRSTGTTGGNRRRRRDGRRSSSMFSPSPISLVDKDEEIHERRADRSSIRRESTPDEPRRADEKSPPLTAATSSIGSEKSPSVMLTAKLASLMMSRGDETPTISLFGSFDDDVDQSASDAKNNTWEGYVDLGSVNVSGGAMGESPPTLAAQSSRVEALPPPNDVDRNSQMDPGCALHSPSIDTITTSIRCSGNSMSIMNEEFCSPTFASSITKRLNSPCFSRRPPTPAILKVDVSNSPASKNSPFLNSPRLDDQTLIFVKMLRDLVPPAVISQPVEKVLSNIDPSFDGILQSLDDLIIKATSPLPKYRHKDAHTLFEKAQKYAVTKWELIETDFLEDLNEQLRTAESNFVSACEKIDQALMSTAFVPTTKSLEREIERLESELIHEQDDEAFVLASMGPSSPQLCQATEQLCLHGFCIEQFEDDKKEVSFPLVSTIDDRHESTFILNLESFEKMLNLRHSSSGGRAHLSILPNEMSFLTKLSDSFLSLLVDDPYRLLPVLLDDTDRDMQGIFLKLARWFGLLQTLSRDLAELYKQLLSPSIYIDFPNPDGQITLDILSRKTTILLFMDPTHDSIETEIDKAGSKVLSLCHGISDWRLRTVLTEVFPDLNGSNE